jgi:abortive infection bacteriophage resistance protein
VFFIRQVDFMSRYEKPALTFEEQADQLLNRGLQADRSALTARLQVTNYYRLTVYLYTFRTDHERYLPGTTLDKIWRLYTFDHRLRMLMLDAIEGIEVHVRTQLAYHFAHRYGPFAFLNPQSFPNFDSTKKDFENWTFKLRQQLDRSQQKKGREDFVIHFFKKYGDTHGELPIWMLVELMDFGSTLSFFRGVHKSIRNAVANTIRQPEEVILSWLLALNAIRNRCAHHSRLWNWKLGYCVLIPQPNKFPKWHNPRLSNNQIGIILMICRYWLNQINPNNQWSQRALKLFADFPEIEINRMGLPSDWCNHPLWKD